MAFGILKKDKEEKDAFGVDFQARFKKKFSNETTVKRHQARLILVLPNPHQTDGRFTKDGQPISITKSAWNELGERQFTWHVVGTRNIGAQLVLQARTLYKSIGSKVKRNQVSGEDLSLLGQEPGVITQLMTENAALMALEGWQESAAYFFGAVAKEVAEFLLDVGLSAPVLRTLKSVAMITTHGVLLVRTVNKQKAVAHSLADLEPLAQYAGEGVYAVLQQKIYTHYFNLGTHIIDGVLSTVDHTGGSGIALAGARLGYKVTLTYRAWRMTKETNTKLMKEETFSMDLLKECPLLGCYILAGEVGANLLTNLDNRIGDTTGRFEKEKPELEKQHKSTKTLVDAARGRVFAAPYVLLMPKTMKLPAYFETKKVLMGNVL